MDRLKVFVYKIGLNLLAQYVLYVIIYAYREQVSLSYLTFPWHTRQLIYTECCCGLVIYSEIYTDVR